MRPPVEYVTAPMTGTIHLIPTWYGAVKTLCGKRTDEGWILGDETLSGIAATCERCRAIRRAAL